MSDTMGAIKPTINIAKFPTSDPVFLQDLLERVAEGIIIYQGRLIVYANAYCLRLIGAESIDDVMGRPILDFVHPQYKAVAAQRIRSMLTTGKPAERIKEVFIKLDGTPIEVEVSSAPVTLNNEPAFLVTFHESPDIERIQKSLKRSEAMIANANEEVYLTDLNGKFLYVNNTGLQSLGYTLEELLEMSIKDLDPLYATDQKMREHVRERKEGSKEPFETIHKTKDGTLKVKEVRSFYLSIEDDEYLCGFARDITQVVKERALSAAFADISSTINSTLEFNSIIDVLLRESCSAMEADSAIFIIREGNHWSVPKAHGALKEKLEGTMITDDEARATALAQETLEVVVVDDTSTDPRVNREWLAERNIASYLVSPLVGAGQVVGSIVLFFEDQHSFDEVEAAFARRLGVVGSLAVQNARVYEAEHENASILQEAQLSLPSKVRGIRFGTLYQSATRSARVGGDFYDVFELRDNQVGILIGDISGKGIRAATLTTLVKSTIRALAFEYSDPSIVLEKANKVLISSFSSNSFATVIFGVLDTRSGETTLAFAGHPPALVRRASGKVERYEAHSVLLGAFSEVVSGKTSFRLGQGEMLFLYTDGMIEARNEDNELYGVERLQSHIAHCKTRNIEEAPRCIFKDAVAWAGGSLADDCAVLAITLSDTSAWMTEAKLAD